MHTLLAPLAADLRQRDTGWARSSLVTSIRRVTLGMIAVWQLIMILAAAVSLGWGAWPLMTLHACLAGAAALSLWLFRRFPVWPLALAMGALGLLAYVKSGDLSSVLVFAACWQINFASCALGLTMLRPAVTPLVIAGAVCVSGTIFVALPEWGVDLPVTIIVTQTSIILALRYGLPPLFALAVQTDREELLSAQAIERAEIAHRTSLQVAEEARVLHDTAVNTLGAIANGGGGIADPERVQRQCAQDLAVLSELQRARIAPPHPGDTLIGAFDATWIPIRRSGLSDEEVLEVLSGEEPQRVAAFAGAIKETVTNAAKHSGAPFVEAVITWAEQTLTVEVSDRGRGFRRETVRARGLARSVEERAEEHRFQAHIESSIGNGTRIVMSLPLGRAPSPFVNDAEVSARVDETIRMLSHRAALLWAGGVTVVSIILSATNPANHVPSALCMIAAMAGSWGWARLASFQLRSRWTVAILALLPSLIYFCAAATTDFGSTLALHWQALAPTAPLVLLLSLRDARRGVVAAVVIWVVTAFSLMLLGLPATPDALAIVAVAASVGLGFGIVWARFQRAVATLCGESAAAERRIFWADLEVSAAQAAQRTYLRWVDTGLEPAILLLQEIVDGTREVDRVDTRLACGYEELYLRQVIQIGPELAHLGPSIFPAMRLAHERGIELTLRLGDQDTTDRASADEITRELITALDGAAPADQITASLFPVREGLLLTVIRASGGLDEDSLLLPPPRSKRTTTAQFLFPVTSAA